MQSEKLKRHQILLFDGDFARLEKIYSTASPTSVIRTLVRKHVEAVEAKLQEREKQDV